MACGAYPDAPINYFLEWRFVDGAVCYYGDQIGVTVFMFIFFGVTFAALYQASGSVMLPVVVLIALAPIVIFLLPAVGIQFVTVILVLMTAIGGFWIYMRMGQ
jgi:hypothetical protein